MSTRSLSAWAFSQRLTSGELARVALELLDAIADGRARGRLLPELLQVGSCPDTGLLEVVTPATDASAGGPPSTVGNVVEIIEYLTRWQPPAWIGVLRGTRDVTVAIDRLIGALPEELALRPVTTRFYEPLRAVEGLTWLPFGGQPRPVAHEIIAAVRAIPVRAPRETAPFAARHVAHRFALELAGDTLVAEVAGRPVCRIPAARLPTPLIPWVERVLRVARRFDEDRLLEHRRTFSDPPDVYACCV